MFEVIVDEVVWPEYAENIAASIISKATSGGHVRIDFSRTRSFQPAAVPRLGNALRYVSSKGTKITVVVPTSRGSDQPQLSVLIGSGIGRQIATHASVIRTKNHQIKRAFKKALSSPVIETHGLRVDDLRRWNAAASRSIGDVTAELARYVNDHLQDLGRVRDVLGGVSRLVAESVWNVVDHSARRPLDSNQRVSSWLCLSTVADRDLSLIAAGFVNEDPATRYFAAMRNWEPLPLHFLQILINDDGVGMAARQSLSAEIYEKSSAVERVAFGEALEAGGSVKLRSRDCYVDKEPGFGSTLVANAIVHLYGYASIRSGRLLAYLDGSLAEERISDGFVLEPTDRSYLPGTTIHVVVPIGIPVREMQADTQARLF